MTERRESPVVAAALREARRGASRDTAARRAHAAPGSRSRANGASERDRGTRTHGRSISSRHIADAPADPRRIKRRHAKPAQKPSAARRTKSSARPLERRAVRKHEAQSKAKHAPLAKPLQRRARRPRRYHPGVFRAGLPRKRLIALLVAAVLVFAAILFRIGMLQTAEASTYTLAGAAQRTQETVVKASRGVIFDRNGAELAMSLPATTIYVNPKLVIDPTGTANALATVLQLPADKKATLLQALQAKTKGFVYVARQVDDQTAANVVALNLVGVSSYREDTRVDPGGDLAKGVVGSTDIDGKGTAGIELQYDKTLTGTDGELVYQHDRQGNEIPGSGSVSVPAVPGQDVVLTIDESIQFSLEQALLKQVSQLGAKGGTGVVEQVGTGNILAMASVQRDDSGVYHVTSANAGAVDCYEPGSVAKVVTISAGLNEGIVTPDTTFMVPGARVFYPNTKWTQTIRDADPHPTEPMTVHDILVQSSNNGTILVSEKLGPEKQWNYMTAFGLGEKSALNFPGESAGLLKNWQDWQGTENVTPAYGYGVCATAIQLVGAVNVVANNGVYVAPRLVSGTIGANGVVVNTPPAATHEVISPSAAQQMNMIMRDVVCDTSGTATAAQVPGVTIAGKTGTGVKNENGVYGEEGKDAKYYSSFVGFFPAEAPQVTTLISVDEPPATSLARFGGTAAAPVFQNIVPTIMHQLGIAPPTTNGGCPKQ